MIMAPVQRYATYLRSKKPMNRDCRPKTPIEEEGPTLLHILKVLKQACKCHLNVYQTLQAKGGVRSIIMRLIIKRILEADFLG